MRASRLLSELLLLQNQGRMTAAELATELEVSVRTVYRDIEALSSSGVPVYADRGRDGGYQLVDGYRTRLTGLTEEEAQSLSLAGLPVAAAELGLGTVLAAAQLKLYAALPAELRERAGTVAQRFFLDVPAGTGESRARPASVKSRKRCGSRGGSGCATGGGAIRRWTAPLSRSA
jgi:predicted DNA-binding transcriptional regulator YafY